MATGAEIAKAYVAITVRAPGIQKDIAKEFGGIDMPSIGARMGSQLSDGIKKTLKVSALAIGGVLAAGIGTALVKGFARLDAIDQATAKLKGLGNSASDVDKIMANALASVKGTSFGLGDAATVAAQAVAAGIKPGAELERVLKSVSNSAAAAGTGMGDMGSIFAKVASLGKAQNDSLQQVADRGIPIYQALADQMGVSTDQVFKLASAGKIGFAEFETAMTAAAGTVAFEMGNTVSGSFSNFLASLGRAGAGVLGGVWSSLAPVLQAATNAMGPLEEIAASLGVKLGEFLAPAVKWLIDLLNNGVDFSMFSPLGLIFEALAPVLPIVSEALKQVASVVGGALAGALPLILPPLIDVLGVLADLVAVVLPPLMDLLKIGAGMFGKLMTAVAPLVGALVGALAPILTALSPIIQLLAQVLTPVVQIIADLLTPVIGFLAEVLTFVVGIITTAVTNAIPWLGQAFQAVWNVIKPVVDWIGNAFKWLWETILQPIFNAIKFALAIVGGVIVGLYEIFVKPIVDAIGAIFRWLWASVISPVIDYIKLAIKGMGIVFSYLWTTYVQPVLSKIGEIFNWIWVNIISPVVTWIQDKLTILGLGFQVMWGVIRDVWDNISGKIKSGWETIKGIIDTLVKVVQNDPKKAFEMARDAIGTAWAGIQDLAKKPVRFVVETVINGLIDTINKIPGVNLAKVPLPPGFSTGGYTGALPTTAVAGVVHGDEHVIRATSRRAIEASHPGLLDHMNQYGKIPGYAKGGLVHPMPGAVVTEEYGGYPGHRGIDLAKPMGTPIRAAASGAVDFSGWYGGGGWMAGLNHGGGLGTRYKHMMSPPIVGVGQMVKQKQIIGYEGSTGDSTGPHLHYEVLVNGNRVNPRPYLDGVGDAGILDLFGGLKDLLRGQFTKAFPGSDMWIDAAWGVAGSGIDAAINWGKSMLPWGGGDPLLYDNGGWLNPGTHLVENRSGRPEPILTASQWDQLLESRSGRGPVEIKLITEVARDMDTTIFSRKSGRVIVDELEKAGIL